MAYIGNTPADKFLTLAKQSFSTSATTSYTLDSSISSTQDIALFINNVRQSPVDAYTVSGTALTLTSATAGTDEMYCVYLGKTVGTVSPASDSVTTAMIQANAVTNAKLGSDINATKLTAGLVPTARLGSGTASSSTVLYGDQTYKAEPSGAWTLIETENTTSGATVDINGFSSDYKFHVIGFNLVRTVVDDDAIKVMFIDGSGNTLQIYTAQSKFNVNESSTITGPTLAGQHSTNPHNINIVTSVGSGSNEGVSGLIY